MGDVADILGVNGSSATAANTLTIAKTKATKPNGMSRELFSLISSQKQNGSLPSIVPTNKRTFTKSGLKEKRNIKATKWLWHGFKNSGRKDSYELKHWVKASVAADANYDYPFARFNVSCQVLSYDNAFYEKFIKSEEWTKESTDLLVALCKQFDLRWFLITDRYNLAMETKKRSLEALKYRYYEIAHIILTQKEAISDENTWMLTSIPSDYHFNKTHEEERKNQLNDVFSARSAETQQQMETLNNELRVIDQKLRKANARTDSRQKKELARRHLKTTRKISSSGVYLRSQCLRMPVGQKALSEKMVTKMNAILKELGISDRPLPTASICDAYDELRQNCIKLLSLYKSVRIKEEEVVQLHDKVKLSLDPTYVAAVPTPVVSAAASAATPTAASATPTAVIKTENKFPGKGGRDIKRKYSNTMYGSVKKTKTSSFG